MLPVFTSAGYTSSRSSFSSPRSSSSFSSRSYSSFKPSTTSTYKSSQSSFTTSKTSTVSKTNTLSNRPVHSPMYTTVNNYGGGYYNDGGFFTGYLWGSLMNRGYYGAYGVPVMPMQPVSLGMQFVYGVVNILLIVIGILSIAGIAYWIAKKTTE